MDRGEAMRRRGSIFRRVRELARCESGIAMPTVLVVTVTALGLGSVAAVGSISAQQGSVRDYDTKLALAAADTGVERAIYRQNKILASAEDPVQTPCLALVSGVFQPTVPMEDGWCPEVSGTVGTATYRYRVKPTVNIAEAELSQVDIVSIGTSDEIGRRIHVRANGESEEVFGEWTVVGDDFIDMDSNSQVDGNAATNGSFFLDSNAGICGGTQYGPRGGFNGDNDCEGYPDPTEGSVDLPLVNQGDVATNNSNWRFFAQDIRTGGDRVQWDAATRTLSINSNSTLTLTGTNYSFCRLYMKSNTTLYIAQGNHVRIYFDSPENCGQPSGVYQMQLESNSEIAVTSGAPASAAFLFVGSDDLQTRILLNSNSTACNEFVIYAPRSDLEMDSNSTFCGAVAANSVHMDSNAHIVSDPGTTDFTIPLPLHFNPTRYVECTGPQGTPPDAGC
jgi:hypothetical protein